MAPRSSTLAWTIPWMEEPGRLQSMGSLGVGHHWVTSLSFFTFHFHALEKEMAPHSNVLAWIIPGMGEPGGLLSMGSHRVRHDWSDLAVAVAILSLKHPNSGQNRDKATKLLKCLRREEENSKERQQLTMSIIPGGWQSATSNMGEWKKREMQVIRDNEQYKVFTEKYDGSHE